MTENQKDYRTKAERIAYLRAEIKRLKKVHTQPWMEEALVACVEALNRRIERILKGEV